MKYYNVEGYVRHKHDLEDTIKRMKRDGEIVYSDTEGTVDYTQMFDDSIIKMWMPLCESLARVAGLLDCSIRTIQRNMCEELKREKELLNQQL